MERKKTVAVNIVWRFAERCGAQMVAAIVSIVLARILDPDVYGTVALISVFTTILQVFVDSGLGNALIQKKQADNLDFSTVFFTNIIFCAILYLLLFISAPVIALFYSDLSLIPYIRVLGITILISGVKNVQQAYVSKHMLFKKFFFSTLGGTITACVVGVSMAVAGFGVWALIAQQLINLSIDTCILWITVKWRPERRFSMERLKGLFRYGWKLLASSLLDTGYRELQSLLIGRIYTSENLAYYNQGQRIPVLVVSNINSSIDSVLLPTLSDLQDEKKRVKEMTRRAMKTSIYLMAPMMMGLIATGTPLIQLLLTEKWLPCLPFFRIFCITYMFYPLHTANLNAIKAMGRSDLFLRLEIWKKATGLLVLCGTIWISVEAMAYSLLVTSVLSQIINSWPNRKLLGYGYVEQMKDILPSIALAAAMAAAVYPISLLNMPGLVILALQVAAGTVLYLLGSVVFRMEAFCYLLDLVKPYITKRKESRHCG